MADKLTLVFAALERLAEIAKDSDLVEYLRHGSQHVDTFINEVGSHKANLKNLDTFTDAHAEATRPSGVPAQTYTKAEVDAMIASAIKRAREA
jgi:hypothetical protein